MTIINLILLFFFVIFLAYIIFWVFKANSKRIKKLKIFFDEMITFEKQDRKAEIKYVQQQVEVCEKQTVAGLAMMRLLQKEIESIKKKRACDEKSINRLQRRGITRRIKHQNTL